MTAAEAKFYRDGSSPTQHVTGFISRDVSWVDQLGEVYTPNGAV